MTLWVLLTVMTAIAAAVLAIPLARQYDVWRTRGDSLTVLREQLRDLDALPDAEAAPLRLELQRRMLAESQVAETAHRPFAAGLKTWLSVGTAAIVAGLSTGLYISLGRPDLAQPSTAVPVPAAAAENAGDVVGMIGQLESKLASNPKDAEGWRMLGWSYFQTRRFADAAEAYRKASELVPTDASFVSALGEALVQSADGSVTPAAQAAFEKARQLDASDARSRYFLALLKEQRGDAKGAIADWVQLLREAPADAPWAGELRRIIAESGKAAGVDVSGQLPSPRAAAAPAGALPGPTPEDVAAAQKMRPGDQQAMIRGMVDGLAAKLAVNPKDAQGWMRLMRARMVLGENGAAQTAYRSGRAAFVGDTATQDQLDAAAKELGIAS